MPIFYVPDNTPSRNYGRNSRTEGYAHPAHGTIGGLAKSATDPRNRGRRRSSDEIEAASRARYDAKQERLAKLREEVQAKEAERKQQESDKRDAARRLQHAKERDAYYAAHPEALAKREREEEWKREQQAKKGQPLKRLTPEEMAANEKAIMARERAALESSRAEAKSKTATMDKLMSERMKPEGPSLSDTLAASEAAGRPHVARAVSNLFASPAGQPASAPAQAKNPQVQKEAARAEPTVFTSREEMLRAAMNPSGAYTPRPRMQGQNSVYMDEAVAGLHPEVVGTEKTWAEQQHPNWKDEDLMGPVQRQAVKDQDDKLAFWAAQYNTSAKTNWRDVARGSAEDFAKDERKRNMYETPDYLRNNFRADPDQGKFSTYKDSPEYREANRDVKTWNRIDVDDGIRPRANIEYDDNGLASAAPHYGHTKNLISGNSIYEPSILDFVREQSPNDRGRLYSRMSGAIQLRNEAEHDAVSQAIDQENKDRRYQTDVGQGRSSDELVSRAFSGPAAETAPMTPLRTPEQQRAARDMQQHTMDADFHGGLPTRAVNLAGETVGDVMNELEVPESFKQSLRFRPGMEFGEPASRPTAIGANATGIGAGRPERKKETFMDWLRSNFPESFSDPNSMYYFPGKFD